MKTLPILIAALSGVLLGQVKTNVPDVVAGVLPFFSRTLSFEWARR